MAISPTRKILPASVSPCGVDPPLPNDLATDPFTPASAGVFFFGLTSDHAGGDVHAKGEDAEIEEEGGEAVEGGGPAQHGVGDGHVRHLTSHSDHERKIAEVCKAGRVCSGEVQARAVGAAILVVKEMRVVEGEDEG